METDDGGWLVFQRREDGTVAFFREWEEYELGFGDVFGEHWLGNFALHAITQQGYYELRIELEDMEQESRYAKYRVFRIEHTKELYQLVVSGYSGTAGDAMWPTNMMAFSTKDRDNDAYKDVHCADSFKGGWWYNACHLSNLNGLYLSGNHTSYADGVNWGVWKGLYYSLKKTEMKIRRAL